MPGFRTQKNEKKYREHMKNKTDKCPLCDRVGFKKFKYWKIIENKFPYDKIAKEHHMLVPIRHVIEDVLNNKELMEFKKIKNDFIKNSDYDYILETNNSRKTHPFHFHLHLIVVK
ncbi:MAG TPA: hypothetical protein VK153_02750 [Candidatus Paceibacterota bacterium]|nr:hypothetical protein [Candidatus Paceibacterota bacterium]